MAFRGRRLNVLVNSAGLGFRRLDGATGSVERGMISEFVFPVGFGSMWWFGTSVGM